MNLDSFSRSFFQPHRFGVIEAKGSDAGRFLNRLSTNSIETLEVGSSCLTAFLNQKARLNLICYVLKLDASTYRLMVPYDGAEPLMTWLDKYLFVEDVTLSDISDECALFWILGGPERCTVAGPLFEFAHSSVSSGFRLSEHDESDSVARELQHDGFALLHADEFETLRVAGKVPFSTNEISDRYHPIQLGLNSAIHWAKGCYIGQEVISRLESKDRAEKTLVGLALPENDWKNLQAGETISLGGAAAGTITSVAACYLPGQANALAVLKRRVDIDNALTDLSKVRIDSGKRDD